MKHWVLWQYHKVSVGRSPCQRSWQRGWSLQKTLGAVCWRCSGRNPLLVLDSTSNAYKERKNIIIATSRLISVLCSLWGTLTSDVWRALGAHHQWRQWLRGLWLCTWEGTFVEVQPYYWWNVVIQDTTSTLCVDLCSGFQGNARDFFLIHL